MKKFTCTLLCLLLVSIVGICVYNIAPDVQDSVQSKAENKRIEAIVNENTEEEQSFSHAAFDELYAVNSDLVAYLEFDSGIVSLPVVQGYNNDQYLRQSFEKVYSSQGVLFMDSEATLNSQHFTIFGHNVYYDDSAKFSPVSKLVSQDFYENNKTFTLYTAQGKRDYLITNVFYFTQDDFLDYNYTQPGFHSAEEFKSWISFGNSRNLIHSEHSIGFSDRFVTLQTCKRWDDQTIILVLAKETGRSLY